MYNNLYHNNTEENRESFLKNWAESYCRKQSKINYGISANTIALNFSRNYFPISANKLIIVLLNTGFNCTYKNDEAYFNISYDSPAIKEFKKGWD